MYPAQFGIQDVPQVPENGGLPAFGISGLNTLGSNAFLPSDEISQTFQMTDNLTKVYGQHTFKMGMEFQHLKFATLQPSWSHGQFNFDGVYTNIPDGSNENTGRAQFVLTPIQSTVPNGVNDVGGADTAYTSNIALADDGRNYWGGYFGDDWKASPKLTFNLAVRWDHFDLEEENHSRAANFVPGPPGRGAELLFPIEDKNIPLSTGFVNALAKDGIALVFTRSPGLGTVQNANFAPRFGFAYQINPKLVVRSGYGIFYNGFENRGFGADIAENYPFQFQFSFFSPNGETPISATTFSNFAGTPCANAFILEAGFSCTPLDPRLVNSQGLGLYGRELNYKTPYTQGYNVELQYALTRDMSLTMGYVGNSVHHLEVFLGTNLINRITPPNTIVQALVPFPDFATPSTLTASEGDSHYNSFQASLEQHYAHGVNFLANYTFSRCRSDAEDLLTNDSITYRAPGVPGFGIQGDFGDCDFDVRHVFHLSGGYVLPLGRGKLFFKNSNRLVNEIVGGWSIQSIITAQGGQPITLGCPVPTTGGPMAPGGVSCYDLLTGKPRHGSGAPDHFLNPAGFTQPCPPAGFPGSAGCVPASGLGLLGGANSQVSGPGLVRWDFSLFKNVKLTERFRLEFRSEFFNVLNHPTFNAPGFGGNGVVVAPGSTDFTNSNFGVITSSLSQFNDPRQIQFALKLYY